MFVNRKKSVEARRVGDTLVAAFHNSEPSLIWKFDLERNHSFTLTLQGEEGDVEIGVTSAKGEFHPVARFSSREDAEDAFAAVQKVLMARKMSSPKDLLKWFGIVLLALLVFMLVGKVVGDVSAPSQRSSSLVRPSAPAPAREEIPAGVPVPADQVLRPPR